MRTALGVVMFAFFVSFTAVTDNGVYITLGLIALVWCLCSQQTKRSE